MGSSVWSVVLSSRVRVLPWLSLWVAIALFAITIAQGLSYTFVWTYVAGHFNVRDSFTQDVAFCITVGSLFAAFLLQTPSPIASVREWRQRPSVPVGVFVVILAMGFLRDVVIWGSFDGARIAWNGLVVAPLGTALFVSVNLVLGRVQPGRRMLRVAAVMVGISVTHGLLAEAGSIWVYAIVCVIAVGMLFVVETWPNRNPEEAVRTLIAGVVIVQLIQIAFGSFPLGWDTAITFAAASCCWVVAGVTARAANLVSRRDGASLVGAGDGVAGRTWYERFNACKLLPFGWAVVLFHSFCWTEPQMAVKPRELPPLLRQWAASQIPPLFGADTLPPRPVLQSSGGRLPDLAAFEAARLHNEAAALERSNKEVYLQAILEQAGWRPREIEQEAVAPVLVHGILATHPGTLRLRQAAHVLNNKNVETEISARQFAKVTCWVFMLFSTFLWWNGQADQRTKRAAAGDAVSGKTDVKLAVEASVTRTARAVGSGIGGVGRP